MKRLILAAIFATLASASLSFAADPVRVVRADRLELLARRIETLGPNQLNMYNWTARSSRPATPGAGRLHKPDDDAYCAGGHATQIFAADGLRWDKDGKSDVVYGDLHGAAACAEFFGISMGDAEWLFSPQSGHQPRAVAASIRKVVRTNQVRLVMAAIR